MLKGWVRDGLSLEEIAKRCGVSVQTLSRWAKKNSDLGQVLAQTAEVSDRMVEEMLYQAAVGYWIDQQKQMKCKQVEYDPDTGKKVREWEEMVPVKETKHIPPNLTALQFWLMNRKPGVWQKNKQEKEAEEMSEIVDDI